MHDAIGTAGMLRGWISIWTTQMVWLLAALAVSIGTTVVVETLIVARARREQQKLPLVPAAIAGCQDPPLG
jgi:hypothetical protein